MTNQTKIEVIAEIDLCLTAVGLPTYAELAKAATAHLFSPKNPHAQVALHRIIKRIPEIGE
jgi:hypothetical protein